MSGESRGGVQATLGECLTTQGGLTGWPMVAAGPPLGRSRELTFEAFLCAWSCQCDLGLLSIPHPYHFITPASSSLGDLSSNSQSPQCVLLFFFKRFCFVLGNWVASPFSRRLS